MIESDRWYGILGLQPSATKDEVDRAWRELVQVWHPDRFPEHSALRKRAEETTRQINEAYQQISSRSAAQDDTAQSANSCHVHQSSMDSAAGTRHPFATWTQFRRSRRQPHEQALVASFWVPLFASRGILIAIMSAGVFVVAWQVGHALWMMTSHVSSVLEGGRPVLTPDPAANLSSAVQHLRSKVGIIDLHAVVPITGEVASLDRASHADEHEARSRGTRLDGSFASVSPERPLIVSRIPPGSGSFRLCNHTDVDAFGTVSAEDAPRVVLASVYVRARQDLVVNDIGPGGYFWTFKTGSGWNTSTGRFKNPVFSTHAIGPFRFVRVQGADGVISGHYEVVLAPERNPITAVH